MEPVAFDKNFAEFKEKYPSLKSLKDYHLFILLAIKYFFCSGDDTAFDQDIVQSYLTDGAYDGGIDAIFNDDESDNNDIIIIQSKYFNNSSLKAENIVGELYKIQETLDNFRKNKFSSYSAKVVSAYKNALAEKSNQGSIRIVFITSYEPKNKRERNKLEKAAQKGIKYPVELIFNSDFHGQIDSIDSGKSCVEYDTLDLDKANNYLVYRNPKSENESVMVNISALSLQDLYQRRQNGLLGMNLRYFVRNYAIDKSIKETIEKSPELFWYKNNGIVIICNKYEVDGTKLKLWGFSIVNGGQTTNRIGNIDIDGENDFYITCKVVQIEGISQTEQAKFALDIAASSNAQKPIRKVDLMANTPEQIHLKERLKKYGIHYLTKKGEPSPKGVESYQITKIDQVGKLSLAAVLQMPGSAHSNHRKMYDEENRYAIFGDDAKCGVIADLLRISYYYEKFRKSNLIENGYDKETTIPMIKCGKTFQLAAITFLCKVVYGVFSYEDEIANNLNDTDDLKKILRRMGPMERIISDRLDDEEKIFDEIFGEIGEDVLGVCYEDEKDRSENTSVEAANYTKLDKNYYKYILKKLWSVYKRNEKLHDDIAKICGMEN